MTAGIIYPRELQKQLETVEQTFAFVITNLPV